MLQITDFSITSDRTEINIEIINASTVASLYFWTESTYKDYNLAIDLSAYLTGSATENITITLANLGLEYFDGIYFLEASDNSVESSAITSDLTRYKECNLNRAAEYSVCTECPDAIDTALLTTSALLKSLEDAIDAGFINEILLIVNALNKICSDECKTCGDYSNVSSNNYYSSNND